MQISGLVRDNDLGSIWNHQTVISPFKKPKAQRLLPLLLLPSILCYFTRPDYFVSLSVLESCHLLKPISTGPITV